MGAIILDRVASVWRNASVGDVGGQALTETYAEIQCGIVPISSFDQAQSFSYDSTHVLWVDGWLELRKEDEIRWGRRLPDAFGNVVPWIYVVQGLRRFTESVSQMAYYVREKD